MYARAMPLLPPSPHQALSPSVSVVLAAQVAVHNRRDNVQFQKVRQPKSEFGPV